MKNNPYVGLLNIMQEQGEKHKLESVCIGQVVIQIPLTVKVGELLLDENDLLITDTIRKESLKFGDILVMVPIATRQKYIVLCRGGQL